MTKRTLARVAAARLPDAMLAGLVMAIVAVMIIPLPTVVLDLLIAGNITAAVLMLLVSLYARDGLSFAAMPTVLLVSTLYRLALNVSSTRLILLQADAGEIIAAFGQFVVRGDYLVGGVIFLVLTLIQFLVVARGAERVAEVGARFTLDAMPGKQLAIDADLRSGLIGPEQARAQRRELERGSQFYGAMDGAMKFVKGDAIAGLVITAINLVAGVAIGSGVQGLGFLASLQRYGLLTIGDGLVSQLPALLVSTAAGVLVTRVAAPEVDSTLSRQIGQQLFGDKRVLRAAGGFLLLLALVPGLPSLPFLGLAAVTWAGSFLRGPEPEGAPDADLGALPGPPAAIAVVMEPTGSETEWRAFTDRVSTSLASVGVPAPRIRVATSTPSQSPSQPSQTGATILLRGRPVATRKVEESLAAFQTRGVDAVVRHAAELLDLQTVQRMLDGLESREPARVRQSIPDPLSLPRLQRLLQGLVSERVSVRDLGTVIEAAAAACRHGATDDGALLAGVRTTLGPSLTYSVSQGGVLHVHPLSPFVEDSLREHLVRDTNRPHLAAPPELAEGVIDAVRQQRTAGAALLVDKSLRPHLRQLLASDLPEVSVLTYAELSADLDVQTEAPIDVV